MQRIKKLICLTATLITVTLKLTACDICGCGVGNSYIGILPDFQKHVFGLRYRYSSLFTHVGVDGLTTYLTTKENYNTVEAWGGWNISKKFRLMASVPYSFNQRTNQGNRQSKDGLGDINVSAYYQLLNNRHTVSNKLLIQSLWIGGGLKLATGKYNPLDKSATTENANLFQLGTGSYDFNVNAMYDIRLQDAGINVASSYKINTANKYDYRYGNKFNVNGQVYYKVRVKQKLLIAPSAGMQYETASNDNDKSFNVTVSGGNLLLGTAGVETAFNKLAIGANFQTPLSQNLANGIVKANNRVMLHISIAL